MTKLTPKNIEWTIADDKIIKKLNDGTFAESEAGDLPIDDTGWYFSSTDVEWALQEIGSIIWGGLPIIAGTTNTVISLTWATEQVLTSTPTLVKDIEMLALWTYTVSFNLRVQTSGWFANWAIYVNWIQQWVTHSTSSVSYTTYSDDITVWLNDNIQLYIYRWSWTPIVENDTMEIKFSYNYASLCNVINP